jgi:tetratricopeptide (TPR) repeat protein
VSHLILLVSLLASGPQVVDSPALEEEAAFRFTVARSLAEEGDVDQALAAWEELVEMAPNDPYVRVEYARLLGRIGKFDPAVRQIEVARNLGPENVDVLRAATDVYLGARRFDEANVSRAVEALEELVRIRPADVQALIDLGRILLVDVDSPARAAEVFARATAQQPASRMLQSYLIEALLRTGDREEAERSLRAFLDDDPAFLRGRLLLANQLGSQGRHHEAVDLLLATPENQMDDPERRWRLASAMYRTGELDEGIEILDELLEAQPALFKERALKGMMLVAQGRNEEAIEVLEDLQQERPDNVEVIRALVKALERQGRDERAEALLRRTARRFGDDPQTAAGWKMELLAHLMRVGAWKKLANEVAPVAGDPSSPLHVQGFLMYAEALHRSGRSEEALDLLAGASRDRIPTHRVQAKEVEILAELDREDESEERLEDLAKAEDLASLLAAAEVYQRQERYAEAVPILSRALEQAETSVQVRYWLAASYERSGDRQSAAEEFRALLDVDPTYAPALNYLGYMWAEDGRNLNEAVVLVDRAVAQEPDNGAYVDSLGWAHFQLGNDTEARELLERAARLLPEDPVILEHLGDVYSRSGDAQRARRSYERALELAGENRDAVRTKLDRLSNGG